MQLIKAPNPILTQIALDWDFQLDTNPELVEQEMIAVMQSYNGIGLAANQVGLLKRVFVIKLKDQEPFAMFNPRVLSSSEELQEGDEGCLSFTNLWLNVKRFQVIESEYFDKLGNQCIIKLEGIDSRCFLHELDHLNGICFTEKVSLLKLALAKKKLQKRKRNG